MDRRAFLTATIAAPFFVEASKAAAQTLAKSPAVAWTQWGGPNRNFQTEASGLKDTWPAGGPRVVWKRPLGEGYSSPAVENGVVYTMYGKPREEVVMAANAETGETLWEQAAPMTFQSDARARWATARTPTPLIVGEPRVHDGCGRPPAVPRQEDRQACCGRSSSGTTHRGSQMMYGYASSPIAFRDTVIVPVGGRGQGRDGVPAGRRQGGVGEERLRQRLFVADPHQRQRPRTAGGADGRRGRRRSIRTTAICNGRCPFKADYSIAVATPVWGPDNLLFVSSEYNAGAKVIELEAQRAADDGDGAVELESTAPPSRQRHAHRRRDLFLERRQRQPGDPERCRCAQRQDPLAAAQHREGDVRVGGSEADHARSGRQPDDRASVAAGVQDRGEGAAADATLLDAAGAGRHTPVHSRSANDDGAWILREIPS